MVRKMSFGASASETSHRAARLMESVDLPQKQSLPISM